MFDAWSVDEEYPTTGVAWMGAPEDLDGLGTRHDRIADLGDLSIESAVDEL